MKENCEVAIYNKISERISNYMHQHVDYLATQIYNNDWIEEMMFYLENIAANLQNLCGREVCNTALISSL